NEHNVALAMDDTVWVWGRNDVGQLGNGTTTNRQMPAAVSGMSNIVSVSGGGDHTLVVRADGRVFGWGSSYSEGVANALSPVDVPGLDAVSVSAGVFHALAVLRDGGAAAWGYGYSGALGDGNFAPSGNPIRVPGLTNVAELATSLFTSYARR